MYFLDSFGEIATLLHKNTKQIFFVCDIQGHYH